ncbi:MAG: transporter substrate-binding domain-containing protein [Treponema sp.]|jgi:serine phosphatase RsbU (regulator of sigma subunit)/ABC-type amino acid transport substrate-binding protein|nr:transporter substrate-binding domain-containing protein [Treponema sp.]
MKILGIKGLVLAGFVLLLFFAASFLVITHFSPLSREPEIGILPDNNYSRTITVVSDIEFDPFSFFGRNGKPSGYDVELLYAVANKMRVNIELRLMDWSDCKTAVANGEAHMITGNPYSQDGYERLIQSRALTNDPFVCIGRENFNSVRHLNNKKLATIEKSGCIIDFLEPYQLVENTRYYTSYTDAVMSVVSGENDYAIVRYSVGSRILARLKRNDISVVGPILANSLLCIGVNENYPELAYSLNTAIKELQDDGTMDSLTTKWLGHYVEVVGFNSLVKIYRSELFIAVILFIVLIAAVVFYVYHNKMKTRHAQQENKLRQDKLTAELEAIDSKIAMERAEAASQAIMYGISYANKIQRNLLPSDSILEESFSDYSVIWEPRDVVGGDIYWIKQFNEGTVLCVCDCTGHGTPGALLAMLVVSALESAVEASNSADTADIIWSVDVRLAHVLNANAERDTSGFDINDGCDLAVLFVARDGSVSLSSGHINVFVSDGKKVSRFRGQNFYVGEGNLNGKENIETIRIPANPFNKFYIASDGLFDQPGGELSRPFGYKAFERIILENHGEEQSVISDKIWTAFEEYRGDELRVDDFELITFKP